jgi:pyruvate/2-oxoglutarate dehydrogenase complex dihydrolipoamide dehydrogenase (E3) component
MAKGQGAQGRHRDRDRSGVESWIAGMAGATLLRGHARFVDPHTATWTAHCPGDRIFLIVGGRP